MKFTEYFKNIFQHPSGTRRSECRIKDSITSKYSSYLIIDDIILSYSCLPIFTKQKGHNTLFRFKRITVICKVFINHFTNYR